MKKQSLFIRIICLILIAVFVLCGVPAMAFDEDNLAVIDGRITNTTAQYLAEYFIRDVANSNEISWSENTKISTVTPLYDINGKVSAYSFDLITDNKSNGYIVISAYEGNENFVTEYSDEGDPTWEKLVTSTPYSLAQSHIIYISPFEIYQKTDKDDYIDLKGDSFSKNELEKSNYHDDLMELKDPTIENPKEYAEEKYGGTFNSKEWRNDFESYLWPMLMTDYTDAGKYNCGPTAIANLIGLWGRYKKISKIIGSSKYALLRTIHSYGLDNQYYFNTDKETSGVYGNTIAPYMEGILEYYGISVRYVSKTQFTSYDEVKRTLDSKVPFILSVSGHNIYGSHLVFAYAYSQFVRSSDGAKKSFLKVEDGWNYFGRYIDMASLLGTVEVDGVTLSKAVMYRMNF